MNSNPFANFGISQAGLQDAVKNTKNNESTLNSSTTKEDNSPVEKTETASSNNTPDFGGFNGFHDAVKNQVSNKSKSKPTVDEILGTVKTKKVENKNVKNNTSKKTGKKQPNLDDIVGAVEESEHRQKKSNSTPKNKSGKQTSANHKRYTAYTPNIRTQSKGKTQKIQLPDGWDILSGDTEYLPVTDFPTIPLTIQFADSSGKSDEYLHPNHPYSDKQLKQLRNDLESIGEKDSLQVFDAPLALLNYYEDNHGIQWRTNDNPSNRKYTHIIQYHIFFAFKDVQYIFASDSDYQFYCLEKLERIRRITTKFNRPIALPYQMYLPDKNGRMKWKCISISIVDISAMQGGKGLSSYMSNVGIDDTTKHIYTGADKARMDLRLLEDPKKFLEYARGDVNLTAIKLKTVEFYNKIADLIGVDNRDDWGLSTGKITASMVSEWIANEVGVPVKDIVDEEELKQLFAQNPQAKTKGFYRYNSFATPGVLKQLSHVMKNKDILYLGMTDGGRCIKERPFVHSLNGLLCDIDISGCYGNGLLNQTFPVGNPKLVLKKMKYKEWEKRFKKYLVAGMWYGRITWDNAPFKQDLLISKEEKPFTAWDVAQRTQGGIDNKDYDASLYLMTNSVHKASYNHDLFQAIHTQASNSEIKWIRENAYIDCFAYYPSNNEVQTLDEDLLEIDSIISKYESGIKWSTKWKGVRLKKLLSVLLKRRKVHKKMVAYYKEYAKNNGTDLQGDITYPTKKDVPQVLINLWDELGELSERENQNNFTYTFGSIDCGYHNSIQEFIKLIVNTIYGCIASIFFGENGTGISNFVVGNNITARARTLAWCMAKGLYSLMSITDGGVFDVNNVVEYHRKSLDIFANIALEEFSNKHGRKVAELVPLYGVNIPLSDMNMLLDFNSGYQHVQVQAWKHLENIFGDIDIFKHNQFEFEVKNLYTECTIRNKSDYVLKNDFEPPKKSNGEHNDAYETIKVRGVRKDDDTTDIVRQVFDDIQSGTGSIYIVNDERMIGLGEWRNREHLRKSLLPHDQVKVTKELFTISPLGNRFIDTKHRNQVLKAYEKARTSKDPKDAARLKELEDLKTWMKKDDNA